ncbi:hypothetical protein ACFVZD_20690 [Streptomyces sp. NPDC058287]|uniref:hypothetical protein n=1 Tax=unclassified Streptomyces TaxID=2593676 RepID=UPI0036E6AEE9
MPGDVLTLLPLDGTPNELPIATEDRTGYQRTTRCCEDCTLDWRSMLPRGIAVVGSTVKPELDIQAMYRSHDTPTPPE